MPIVQPRSPVYAPRPALSPPDQFWSQNLLETTLSAIQKPLNQRDWPNPSTAPRPDETWVWSYNLNLIGKDIVPGKSILDIPPRTIWFQDWSLNLLETTLLPLPPGPGKIVTDLPPLHVSWYRELSVNLLNLLTQPVAGRAVDLPPPPVMWYRDLGLNLALNLPPPVKLPFNQYDWPLPTPQARYAITISAFGTLYKPPPDTSKLPLYIQIGNTYWPGRS